MNETLRQRDDFDIYNVNFPFICRNIPAAPAYEVYISQFIRYSIVCDSSHYFLNRGVLLIWKLACGFIEVITSKVLRSPPWLLRFTASAPLVSPKCSWVSLATYRQLSLIFIHTINHRRFLCSVVIINLERRNIRVCSMFD